MWFNSLDYLLFFLVVYTIYWSVPSFLKKYILLFASFFFYAYWNLAFFFHFLGTTIFSYAIVSLLRKEKKKSILLIGVGANLLNLIFFKYSQSFINGILSIPGNEDLFFTSLPKIILPLAISFYTFQIIAFIVDTYRTDTDGIGFIDFILFIFFFPQLIAGPIMRHSDFFHQLGKVELKLADTQEALLRIISGVFKKVLIADQMARIINPIWNDPTSSSGSEIFLAIIGFSVQVYSDFSGYTDIARGSALLLGYRIPENFRSPYFSLSFSELWSRWHITLSTWLRDYLFIPLGGSRVTNTRLYFNTLVVMSLGGLWHGDTYTFFLWGLIHGTFLILERRWGVINTRNKLFNSCMGWVLVTIGWLIGALMFRSGNWETFSAMMSSMTNPGKVKIYWQTFIELSLLCYAIQFLELKNFFQEKIKFNQTALILILSVVMYFAIVRIKIQQDQFIYFQF
ncbi:MAG: MBOAT family protein [Leptospira sp.]|nr:MBOAT family protein [Leptospira sp.]NCS95010.1 MBOAT family protein [Leptospira sp.]